MDYGAETSPRDDTSREVIALGMHTSEADSPRLNPAGEISYFEAEELLQRFAAIDSSYEYGRVAAAARREELLTHSGLLLPQPNERVSFCHLSIQDFSLPSGFCGPRTTWSRCSVSEAQLPHGTDAVVPVRGQDR